MTMPIAETYMQHFTGRLTGTNQSLPLTASSTPCCQILVQADPDNTADIFVGFSDGQNVVLEPGHDITIPVDMINKVYVRFPAAGQYANWMAVG